MEARARPIKEGSRARRGKRRRKEGNYASSLPGDDAGVLDSDLGLTLLPGLQIQQVKVDNGSSDPDGAVSNEQDCDSQKQRRSGEHAARNAINATSLAFMTRQEQLVCSSPAQGNHNHSCEPGRGKQRSEFGRSHIGSQKNFSNAIPNAIRTTISNPISTTIGNTISAINITSFPANSTSIKLSCIRPTSTYSHPLAGDIHCHLPSVDQGLMMLSTMGSYPAGASFSEGRSIFQQQPIQPSHQPSFQQPIDPRLQLHTQPANQQCLNMNSTGIADGWVGTALTHRPVSRQELSEMAFQAVPRLRKKIEVLEEDKHAMDLQIKTLNNANLAMANELKRVRNDNCLLNNSNVRLSGENHALKNSNVEMGKFCAAMRGSGGPVSNLALMQSAEKLKQELAQLKQQLVGMRAERDEQKAAAQMAENNFTLSLKQAADKSHQEMVKLREELASMRSDRDHHRTNAVKAVAMIRNAAARSAATKVAEANKGAGIVNILSSFRVETPRPASQATPIQPQAPAFLSSHPLSIAPTISTTQPISPTHSVPPPQPYLTARQISAIHSASTSQRVPTFSTAQPISPALHVSPALHALAALPVSTAQSPSAPQPNSSLPEPVTIDLTVDDPSSSNPDPSRRSSCPEFGNLSASTHPDQVPAPAKRKYAWLDHHPLRDSIHPHGYKSPGMTIAGRCRKRLEAGLINPVAGLKRRQSAKKPSGNPAKKPARQSAEKPASASKDRSTKRQRVENGDHQNSPLPERVTYTTSTDEDREPAINSHEDSTSTNAQYDDGLDDDIEAALAEMADDNIVSSTYQFESDVTSDEDEEPWVTEVRRQNRYKQAAPVKEKGLRVSSDDEEPCTNRNTTHTGNDAQTIGGLNGDSESSDQDKDSVPPTHQKVAFVPPVATAEHESDGLDEDIAAALAEMSDDEDQFADTLVDKCPRCDLEGGHPVGGEKCICEDDGLDDLFEE